MVGDNGVRWEEGGDEALWGGREWSRSKLGPPELYQIVSGLMSLYSHWQLPGTFRIPWKPS